MRVEPRIIFSAECYRSLCPVFDIEPISDRDRRVHGPVAPVRIGLVLAGDLASDAHVAVQLIQTGCNGHQIVCLGRRTFAGVIVAKEQISCGSHAEDGYDQNYKRNTWWNSSDSVHEPACHNNSSAT